MRQAGLPQLSNGTEETRSKFLTLAGPSTRGQGGGMADAVIGYALSTEEHGPR